MAGEQAPTMLSKAMDSPDEIDKVGKELDFKDSDSSRGGSIYDSPESASAEQRQLEIRLAKKETKAVAILRLCLLATLVAATVAVSWSVYAYTRHQEERAFSEAFADGASKLGTAFELVVARQLGIVANFAVTITSLAIAQNATWPFFTVPAMEAHASHTLSLVGAKRLVLSPIVEAKDREEWGRYVIDNIDAWAEESYVYHERKQGGPDQENVTIFAEFHNDRSALPPYEGQPDYSRGYSSDIYHYTNEFVPVVSEGEGPFMAWWQSSPMVRSKGVDRLTNYDMLQDFTFGGNLLTVLSKRQAGIGRMMTEAFDNNGVEGQVSGFRFYYPVLESLEDDAPLVASIASNIYWDTFFVDVLPQNMNGFIAVLRNGDCDQVHTFEVNGAEVSYLGDGDLHDPTYDEHMQEYHLNTLINGDSTAATYLGLPLDEEEGCQYTLHVYASETLENDHVSNRPIIYTVVAVAIFLMTSLAFVLYDRLVEHRQRLVMKEASASGAIVASLFPAAYRERLMQAQEEEQGAVSKESPLSSFLKSGAAHREENVADEDQSIIADLYENCSILFGDIAGFTAWSSTRSPSDVFTLLQTLFRAFDRIANRRKVFKIETIGDCYLAVTGLPEPQHDHAMLMVKFANEILEAHRSTVQSLVGKLGAGTETLSLRVGIHSGAVTAGILRGEKSRFQLFGDTVNTASRMESTGQKDRIQISPTTAELLTQAGKSHWIAAREELVDAKGKGKIQTYWVTTSSSAKRMNSMDV